jgi:hypothetical protein
MLSWKAWNKTNIKVVVCVTYDLGVWPYLIQMHVHYLLLLKCHEIHAHLELKDVIYLITHLVKISWKTLGIPWKNL